MLEPDDLAIVGGGQSAKYLLLAIAHAISGGRLPKNIRVCIYEEGDACGPGWAWNPAHVDDIHLSSLARPSQRATVGREERLRFPRVITFLRELGASVNERLMTRVVAIDRRHAGWRLTDSHGMTQDARHVVLAIGHSAFAPHQLSGMHCLTPWPFDMLYAQVAAEVRKGQTDVLVLGGYLTAVDVVTGLAARFSTLEGRFRMHMLSRSGELPKVWGAEPRSLDVDAVARRVFGTSLLDMRASGQLGFAACERIVLEAVPDGGAARPTSLDAWLRQLCQGESAQRLKSDLLETAGNETLAWQSALFGCLPLLSEAFSAFSDADKLRFLAIRSRYYRAAMPMARDNAHKFDALLGGGRLSVMAAPDGYRIEFDASRSLYRLWLADQGGAEYLGGQFGLVIAAAGPEMSLSRTPSPLLRYLYDQGTVVPVWAQSRKGPIELGGVRIDCATCETLGGCPAPSPSIARACLFAMGPLVVGTFPDAQSVGHIARDAERIVNHLIALTTMAGART